MQIWSREKSSNNYQKIGFGKVLDSIWEGVGAAWGIFWPLFQAWVQDALQETFWIDFGRIWGEFGCVLGEFGHSKLKLLRHMVISWTLWVSPAASRFATRTPALPRFASRSVTIENFWNFEFLAPKILVRNWPERTPNEPFFGRFWPFFTSIP